MTSQEQEMISGLIDRVQKTQLPEKDPDAEQMLQTGLGRNPDSLYILSQTVLVQQYALDGAQKQLADLKAQLAAAQSQAAGAVQPKHSTSFLGSIFGSHDEDRPAPPPPPPAYNGQPAIPPYAPVQNYSQPGYGQGGYAPASSFGAPAPPAGGGFLRSAMQTATGVAAGALAFQGIESLMHGFGGGGMGFGGGGGGRPEEVINNYYGDDAREHHDDRSGLSPDVQDRRDDSSFFNPAGDASRDSDTDQFAGGGDNDDTGSMDDNTDNSDSNDSSFTDDSGGDFGGGGDDSNFS